MKVLIIEDEHFAEQELKRLLAKCGYPMEILASLDTIRSSVQWLHQNPMPDLVFMDIQLSDGLSFEIFNQVRVNCPVIFTTAYDEYAIRAFKVNSIDYLLKPVELHDLQEALDKYQKVQEQMVGAVLSGQQLSKLLNFGIKKYKDRFVSKVGDYLKYIQVEDIAYFFAEDKTVYLVTKTNEKFIVDFSLDQLEPLLDPKIFFRLNRGYITKLEAIEKAAKYFNGRIKVWLTPPVHQEVTISRAKVPRFKNWLEGMVIDDHG